MSNTEIQKEVESLVELHSGTPIPEEYSFLDDCQIEENVTTEEKENDDKNSHESLGIKLCFVETSDEEFLRFVKSGGPGLKHISEVDGFLELMYCSEDISQKKMCLATLIATEDQSILEKVLVEGGWDSLFEWLEGSRAIEDMTYLARLLDLYRLLPVTVHMLKQNACAKSIKQLIKSPNEVISRHAKMIIDNWMLKVTKNKEKEKEHGSRKSKKLKHLERQKSDESEQRFIDDIVRSPTDLEKPASRKRSSSMSTETALPEAKITVKILPPKPPASETMTHPQGFMNALSSVNILPERKKKIRRPSKVTLKTNINTTNDNNNVDEADGDDDDDDDDDDEKTDVEEYPTDSSPNDKTPSHQHRAKKRRKTVTWCASEDLCTYHYFPMDETERVNVNHDFNEVRRHEIEMEHRMFQNSRRNLHDDQWRRPLFISGVSYLVQPGCNSTEKKTQMAREQNVLQVLYFNKRWLTDYPAEPDPESVDFCEQKQIPLSDITGTNSEVLYEHTGHVTSTPSSVLSSSSCSTPSSTSSSCQAVVMTPVESSSVNATESRQTTVTVTVTQTQPSVTPPWGNMYPVPPPPIMTHMMDPQVIQTLIPPMMTPMYPQGFISPPGFVPAPPHLQLPEFLRGYRPPMPHMSLNLPPFGTASVIPCAHFIAGNCKYGTNCRFFHPPTSASTSSCTSQHPS